MLKRSAQSVVNANYELIFGIALVSGNCLGENIVLFIYTFCNLNIQNLAALNCQRCTDFIDRAVGVK